MTEVQQSDSERRIHDYLRVLRKHRWLITGVFLVTVATVAIWTHLQVPIFQAAATVLIDISAVGIGDRFQPGMVIGINPEP